MDGLHKLILYIQKDKDIKVSATCICVPVMRAHAESVNLQFASPLDENEARDILKKAPGVVVFDDRASNRFPTPLEFSLMYDVAVGRIRQDESQDGDHGFVNHEQTVRFSVSF
ncbi:putative aspartate-semialdehyde dehydrogenase [Helianthus debilis subsp. tardiflorus]